MSHHSRKHREYEETKNHRKQHSTSSKRRYEQTTSTVTSFSPSSSSPSRYSSSSSTKRTKLTTTESYTEKQIEPTNLLNFSFNDYKSELGRVLIGYRRKDQLIDDLDDFWLFLNKYETLLKRSGQCILPDPNIDTPKDTPPKLSTIYDKSFNVGLRFCVPFDELQGRLSSNNSEKMKIITKLKLQQFLQIVLIYLDFKQKEKFMKLKKLRHFQEKLPVAQYKDEIVNSVRSHQVILIAGDTGCGKSTQVPQFLSQAGFENIACTQPRRIACISLSKRVAHEMLCEYGTEVGYQIRFERNKSTKTKILFITEGLLLRQLSTESSLSQYDVLVLDEVHERHLHGDFLLGVAKCLLRIRPTLKLVLMSATINIELFCNYFAEEMINVIEVPGRLFPIKLNYMPQLKDYSENLRKNTSKSERLSPEPFIQIMQLIDQKYPSTEKGDLLIFMSGLNEITTIVDAAKDYAEKKQNWIILPLHSTLSISDQDKVFDYAPDGMRKCIVSTNISETSVTIDGIRFVIDSGKVKEMSYDPMTKMQRLKEFWISKASADQRKGRAGRTGPGVCYRLYAQKQYEEFENYSSAEIHRVPLESLLLNMISMGLPNARLFPFIESPPSDSIENAILSLKQHDALTASEKLTTLGMALSKLPVDISIGKMLLMGSVFQQLQPVLTMAAALSVQSPFTNRAFRDPECQKLCKDLESDHGDPITLLNAYKEWLELKEGNFNRQHNQNTKQWCRRRGLEEQRFYEMTKLRNQFDDLLKDAGIREELVKPVGEMSSGERAIRHGELRQLRQLRREHKNEAPRKRKLLKGESSSWNQDGDDDEQQTGIDIRDVEFRLSHDPSKIQNLVSGATACSYRDLMTLKLILVSGLYPQIAISDEFNYCKSPSQQFYHTEAKPFASLHPMGYFANNSQILQLNEPDIIEKTGMYKSKLPLSSRHQLLCYLSLLETTKPYLMNTMRMPAAQTLLLFAHTIDTNLTFSRIICDSWLCLDFPVPETGQNLLFNSSNLRRLWTQLLDKKLEVLKKQSIENSIEEPKDVTAKTKRMEQDLLHDLSKYMNSEVVYTLKRLLPADLKSIYVGTEMANKNNITIESNPFIDSTNNDDNDDDFIVSENLTKGGIYLTNNITFGCVKDTDWSVQLAKDALENDWTCSQCKEVFNITGIEKLQHKKACGDAFKLKTEEENAAAAAAAATTHQNYGHHSSGKKPFDCLICNKKFYFTSVEILKHKKSHKH